MSRKVFTAGEVLAAADVNSFLMDQSVMSFAGTAARGSAIPSPVEGMYTHLEDSDSLQFWNGSAWRSPLGLTLINTTAFTSVTAQTINNLFTSEFDNYKILVDIVSSTGNTDSGLQLTQGGTPATTNYYSINSYAEPDASGASKDVIAFINPLGTDEFFLTTTSTSISSSAIDMTLYAPNLPIVTKVQSTINAAFSTVFPQYVRTSFGHHNSTTQFDGIKLNFASTTTGTISIYGWRK